MGRLALRLAAFVVAMAAALPSSAASVEALAALNELLHPTSSAEAKVQAFRVLDGQRDQGWSLVPRLLELTRSADAGQRERARWVLWCIVGPEAYKVLNELGPEPERRAVVAHLMNNVDPARPWDGLTKSLALARSELPAINWIGLWNLRVMLNAAAPPRTQADRENVDRIFRELRGVAALKVDDKAAKEPMAIGERGSLLESARRWAPQSAHAIAFLVCDKSARADRLLREAIIDGRISTKSFIIAVTDVLLESAWFQPDELLAILASTRGEVRARVVSRALAAASHGSAPGRTILRYLSGQFHSDEIRIAEILAELEPAEVAQFQPMFDLVATQDVRGGDQLMTRLIAHNDLKVRRAAARIVTAVPRLFGPEEAIAALVERGRTPTVQRIRELNPDSKALGIRLVRVLKGKDAGAGVAAAHVIALVGSADVPEVREALLELARSGEESVRVAAADALDDAKARRAAHAPAVLRDLRSAQPATRLQAAKRAQTLGMGDERLTAALLKAVSAGDMAAREGLTLALERAHATGSTPLVVLEDLARSERDPTTRAYVKAALRVVGTAP